MRYIEIDIVKGIGIILVVLGHLNVPFHNYIYSFHMPLFFFVSGFFFTEKNILKRMRVLFQAYIFYYIIGVIKYVTVLLIKHETIDSVIVEFNPEYINGPIWFIMSLIITTIFSYCILKILKNKFIVLILSLIIYFIGIYLIKQDVILPLYIGQSLLMQLFYLIGYFIYDSFINNGLNIISWIKKVDVKAKIITIIFSLIIVYFLQKPNDVFLLNIVNPYYFIITSIFGTIAIIFTSTIKNIRLQSLLAFCGKNSLHIMGIHKLLISPLYSYVYPPFFKNIAYNEMFNNTTLTIITFLIIMILSLIWSRIISLKFNFFFK